MTIHLHLGAHKTASTHIQASLRRAKPRLEAAGVRVALPDELREIVGGAGRRAARGPVSRALLTKAARRDLAAIAGAPLTIASDENAIGSCVEIVRSGVLYPTAAGRLSLWRDLTERDETTMFLALRAYPAFFAAAHAQAVRARGPVAIRADARKRILAPPRRWPDLVADLRAALPAARLKIWAFEDHAALSTTLLAELTGRDDVRPVKRRSMRTPSRDAMRALMTPSRRGGSRNVAALLEAHPITPDNPRYSPFSREETDALLRLYAEDLMRLQDDQSLTFLSA